MELTRSHPNSPQNILPIRQHHCNSCPSPSASFRPGYHLITTSAGLTYPPSHPSTTLTSPPASASERPGPPTDPVATLDVPALLFWQQCGMSGGWMIARKRRGCLGLVGAGPRRRRGGCWLPGGALLRGILWMLSECRINCTDVCVVVVVC
jgi:hypothetical protein